MNLVYGSVDPGQKSAVILNMKKLQGLEKAIRKEKMQKDGKRKVVVGRALNKLGFEEEAEQAEARWMLQKVGTNVVAQVRKASNRRKKVQMAAQVDPVGRVGKAAQGNDSLRSAGSAEVESEAGSEEDKRGNQSTGSEKSFNTKLKEAEEREQSLKKHHALKRQPTLALAKQLTIHKQLSSQKRMNLQNHQPLSPGLGRTSTLRGRQSQARFGASAKKSGSNTGSEAMSPTLCRQQTKVANPYDEDATPVKLNLNKHQSQDQLRLNPQSDSNDGGLAPLSESVHIVEEAASAASSVDLSAE